MKKIFLLRKFSVEKGDGSYGDKDSAGKISDQTGARSFSAGRVPLLEKESSFIGKVTDENRIFLILLGLLKE